MTTDTDEAILALADWEFDKSATARIAEATRYAEATVESEQRMSASVSELRGDHALGLVDRGRLLKAQRALAEAQEIASDASALLKATERQVQRERDQRATAARQVAIANHQAHEAEHAQSVVQARELYASITAALTEIDGLPSLPPPCRQAPAPHRR